MIDKANCRGCYDRLLLGDIETVLCRDNLKCGKQAPDKPLFDIIFACNVLSFIQDIRAVFQSVRNSLKPGDGVFAFSAEFIEDDATSNNGSSQKLVLQPCARYAHVRTYVETVANESGFTTKAMESSELRRHEGRSVKGVLVVMTLSST
jgi:predicted TPR repeat methyltransferase